MGVVDILRVGLSGLCFLLAYLGYRLIGKEQVRIGSPRRGILRIIQLFIASNLAAGVLCAVSGYVAQRPAPACSQELSGSYVPDSTSFVVDLEQWQPEGKGPVVVTRTDHIRKMTSQDVDYVVPFFTTGSVIGFENLQGSTRPLFVRNGNPDIKGRVQYDYRLPTGHQPAGYTEVVTSKFTYTDGFKNPDKEWWQGRIAFPTKTVVVTIRFADNKRCKDIEVFAIPGDQAAMPITDNPATISNDGRVVQWVGLNQPGNTRIQFTWNW